MLLFQNFLPNIMEKAVRKMILISVKMEKLSRYLRSKRRRSSIFSIVSVYPLYSVA